MCCEYCYHFGRTQGNSIGKIFSVPIEKKLIVIVYMFTSSTTSSKLIFLSRKMVFVMGTKLHPIK